MSLSTFICASVNYKLSDRTCELLAENNQTASVAELTDDNWQHFIRPICAGKWSKKKNIEKNDVDNVLLYQVIKFKEYLY